MIRSGKPGAVILAAGMGQRLGALTDHRPKALLPLNSEGHSFLDRAISLLLGQDAEQVVVVGGHAITTLNEHLRERWPAEYTSGLVRVVPNDSYRTVNNIGSVLCAGQWLAEGAVLLNSDIVFDASILEDAIRLVRDDPSRSFMVVDSTVHLADEEMKVALDDGRVRAISKRLDPATAVGEYIGILYLAPEDARAMLDSAQRMIESGGTGLYYEDALAAVLDDVGLQVIDTDGRLWTEVDTIEDYERAQRIFGILAQREAPPTASGW